MSVNVNRVQKNRNISSNDVKKLIIDYLTSMINMHRYNPKSIESEDDLAVIRDNNYSVTPKFKGAKIWVVFTTIDDTPYAVSFNRQINSFTQLYPVNLQVERQLYNGTILEGMYTKTKEGRMLIIDEVYLLKGKNMLSIERDERMRQLGNVLRTDVERSLEYQIYPCKQYAISKETIKELFNMTKVDQQIDGWLFHPPFYTSKNHLYYYMIKMDDLSEEVTANHRLLMRKTSIPDVYELFKEGKIKIGIAHVPNSKASIEFKKWFKETGLTELTVNCKYIPEFNKWQPVELINTA